MDILPLEIHQQIFRYLKQKDLQTCYFVCKSWYSMAIPLNWEEVILNRIQIDIVKSHLKDSNRSQYFKYGHLIMKLTIKDFDFPPIENRFGFSKLKLLVLLKQFPNLKEINLSQSGHFKEYLEFLFVSKMRHINKITRPFNPNSGEDHLYNLLFLVYYRFRESITCMNLLYDKSTVTFDSEQVDLLNSLTHFKQLTELVFYNKHDADLTPLQLHKMCPNLKLLRFISDYPISDSAMLHLSSIGNSGINLNFIGNLTNLELRIPSLSATYTKYLADYLPDQLNGLNIEILRQGMFNWIDLVGMELASRFMEKAGKLEEVFIYFESSDLLEAPDGDETRPTIFFKLLNVFRKTPQSYCEAIFCGNYDDDDTTGYSFRYTPDGRLTVFYDLRVGPIFSLDLPDKTSSVIGPEVFDSLEFNMSGVNYDVVNPALTYALLNCPRIQSFDLLGNESQDEGGSFYLRYKHKENSISSQATQRNITYLEIRYISPVQCYFDLASTYLLDIEIISLQIKDGESLEEGSVIDLTSFKKLKTFTVEIGNVYGYNDLIAIEYADEEKEKYYDIDKDEYSKPNDDTVYPRLTILCNTGVSFNFCKHL